MIHPNWFYSRFKIIHFILINFHRRGDDSNKCVPLYYIQRRLECILLLLLLLVLMDTMLLQILLKLISIRWNETSLPWMGEIAGFPFPVQWSYTSAHSRGVYFRKFNPPLFARLSLPRTEIRLKHNEGVIWAQNKCYFRTQHPWNPHVDTLFNLIYEFKFFKFFYILELSE